MTSTVAMNTTIFETNNNDPNLRYGYVPTLWVCAVFISLFGLSTLLHIGQSIYYKAYWLLPTAALAGLAEVIGWSGRLWSSKNPTLLDPYLMQITTTIIAPTPLVAASFIILGQIIQRLGRQYSRLSPKWYSIIFVSFDIIALVVQSIGGASASQAAQKNEDASTGGNIMLGGIAFQMAAITLYVALAAEFLTRYFLDRPIRPTGGNRGPCSGTSSSSSSTAGLDAEKATAAVPVRGVMTSSIKLMVGGLIFSTICIFIRSVYRTIELSDGWTGRIIHTQVYFNVLDGAMIVLAIFTLNVLHPSVLLK